MSKAISRTSECKRIDYKRVIELVTARVLDEYPENRNKRNRLEGAALVYFRHLKNRGQVHVAPKREVRYREGDNTFWLCRSKW